MLLIVFIIAGTFRVEQLPYKRVSKVVKRPNTGRNMAKESAKTKVGGLKQDEYYFTDQGFLVFTKEYHQRRGYCCKSGCRHCPYGYQIKDG